MKIKILIIPSWYPTKENNLSGIFFKEQAEALAEHNLDVSLLYFKLHDRSRVRFKPFWIFPNFRVRNINKVKSFTFRWVYLSRIKVIQEIQEKILFYLIITTVKLVKNFDLIHVHSAFQAGLNVYQYCKRRKIPYILTEHSSAFLNGMYDQEILVLVKEMINNSVKTIAVSEYLRDILINTTKCRKDKVVFIPNIIDMEKFLLKKSMKIETICIATICFLKENKGVDILLYAINKLVKKDYQIKLTIGGDGPLFQKLINLTKELELIEYVEFIGRLDRDQVKNLLQRTDIYVSSSYIETFGITLIEALSTGIPVVSTNSGGPASIINNDNGILVEPGKPDKLAIGLEYVINNLDNYIPQVLRDDVAKRFSKEAVTKKIIKIYSKIVGSQL